MEMQDVLTEAARGINKTTEAYGSIYHLYRQAALSATVKTGKEVTEYDIVIMQMAFTEAQMTLNRLDLQAYSTLATLASLAGGYAKTDVVDKSGRPSFVAEVEERLTQDIRDMAQKLAPNNGENPA